MLRRCCTSQRSPAWRLQVCAEPVNSDLRHGGQPIRTSLPGLLSSMETRQEVTLCEKALPTAHKTWGCTQGLRMPGLRSGIEDPLCLCA